MAKQEPQLACYLDNSVILVNARYSHSAMHVDKCLRIPVMKMFLSTLLDKKEQQLQQEC